MNIETFQKNIKNIDLNLRPYILVVSIFLSILVIIILFNNNLENYYVTKATVKDKEIIIIVDIDNLDKITSNKKIKIERNIFTYKVLKINDLESNGIVYKEVIIKVEDIDEKLLIDNNIINTKIIVKKSTMLDYLLKTMKGEWSIKQVNNSELKELDGGGLTLLGAAGIVAGAIFVIGVIDGYVRPQKCNQ